MRLSGAPTSRFLRATLAGATAAVAPGGALIAAPAANAAANAAAIRPAVTAGMGCIAESVGAAEGTVDCNVTPGGVAPTRSPSRRPAATSAIPARPRSSSTATREQS